MFEIQHYRTAQGVDLFDRWIEGLRDRKAVAKVLTRINRVSLGNFGDYRALDGVYLNCGSIGGRVTACISPVSAR